MATLDVYKDWLGIPEEFRPPTHYQLLRLVDFEDDQDRIYKFYKKLNSHVRKYATGKYSIESQELLNELAKAMLCLTDIERKQEYDVGLGREIPEEDLPEPETTGEFLLSHGVITKEQLGEVVHFAERRGLTVRDAAVQMKLATLEQATRAYANEHKRSYLDLSEVFPEDSVLDKVPRSTVRHHSVIPLMIDDDVVLVACAEEPAHELEDEIRMRFEMPMRAVMATPRAINQAISTYYPPGVRESVETPSGGKKKNSFFSLPQKNTKGSTTSATQSAENTSEQRNITIIILCWLTVLGYLIDEYVVHQLILTTWSSFWGLSVIIPSIFLSQNYNTLFPSGKK